MKPMQQLQERLRDGEIIIMDGGMGTELERRGAPMHGTAWSAAALLSHPDLVRTVHEDFMRAGADIHITNTFAAHRGALEPAGFGDQVEMINRRAVRLAQEAREQAAGGRPVVIAGSISSFAGSDDGGLPDPDEAEAHYAEQAHILAEAGVDLLLLEMMKDIHYASRAVKAAGQTGLPVWVGFSATVTGEGVRLLADNGAESLADGVAAVMPVGGDLAAIMHTLTEHTMPALEILRSHWQGPMAAYPHSGRFIMPNWQFIDIIAPADFAAAAHEWIRLGVQVIGGCCGIGPEHIRALKQDLPATLSSGRRRRR